MWCVLPLAAVAVANPLRADVFNMPAGLTSLKFSNVGDPGNVGDTVTMNAGAEDGLWISGSADHSSGYGAVAYQYAIGTYDVTTAQYVQFLNAVARTSDPYGLYNPLMGGATSGPASSDPNDPIGTTAAWITRSGNGYNWPVVCGITRTGTPGNYSYALSTTAAANLVSPPLPSTNGNFPVNWDSWGDAARFCNWLENGQPTGPEGPGTTETGSYTLNGATTIAQLFAVTPNPGATYWIPTENEWYKAAYYKTGGTNAGYWYYPTKSSSTNPPSSTLSTTGTNNANFNQTGINAPNSWILTPVGYFAGSPGPYGTYARGGDVYDFTETKVQQSSDTTLEGVDVYVMRGGSFSKTTPIELASNYRTGADPAKYGHARSFRLTTWYTTVWNGGGTGATANNWSAAGNWTGAVPTMAGGVGVAVQFGPLSSGHVANNNDLATGTQLNGISFAAGAPVYNLAGNSILLGGPVTNQSGNTQTIGLAMQLVAGGGAFNTSAGSITVTGALSGTGSQSLVKSGTGTLTFAGSNTYSGATTINQGDLIVDGWLTNSAVMVDSGGALSGTGSINRGVDILGGHLAPGDLNTGALIIAGNVGFQGGEFDVVGASSSITSMSIMGDLSLNDDPTLYVTGSLSGGSYTIASYGGTLSGQFGTLDIPAGYTVAYGTGSNSSITLAAVPEPSTLENCEANGLRPRRPSHPVLPIALASGFNSASLPAGSYTGTVTVTGTNSALDGPALNSGAAQTVTVNVLGHAAGSVTVTAGNGSAVRSCPDPKR